MLNPEKDNNSIKKFWKYIKSTKQISVVIQGTSWCFPIFFFGICLSMQVSMVSLKWFQFSSTVSMFAPDSNLAIHLSLDDIKRLIRKKQRLYNKSKKSKKPSHKKAFKGMRILLEINYTRTIGIT
jgi:hypothetical protein